MNAQPITTTVYDDRPKFQAIIVLAIFFGILVSIIIASAVVLGSLHLDERARIALEAAKAIGDSTRYYKVMFIIVLWLDLAVFTTTVTISVSAMIGARAVAAVRAALLSAGPRVIAAPARQEELEP